MLVLDLFNIQRELPTKVTFLKSLNLVLSDILSSLASLSPKIETTTKKNKCNGGVKGYLLSMAQKTPCGSSRWTDGMTHNAVNMTQRRCPDVLKGYKLGSTNS